MAKEIRPLYRANDSTGVDEIFYPATTTDAIAHPTKRKSLTTVLDEIENGSVYDISAAHNNQPYADLAAALGTNGANIPADIRRGGMSVKFIEGTAQSSDNKYVQYRLIANSWSKNTYFWERYNDVTTSNQSYSDLDIADEQYNVLVRFSGGHIKTKNFDSAKDATEEERGLMPPTDKTKLNTIEEGAEVNDVITDDVENTDLDISDENGNVLMQLKDGHVKTKNFDSANINTSVITDDIESADLTLSDENGNTLAVFKDGHIRTKNFDSSNIGETRLVIDAKSLGWTYGYISSSNTYNYRNTSVVLNNLIKVKKGSRLEVTDSNVRIQVLTIADDDTISYTTWSDVAFVVENDCRIRFGLKYTDDRAMNNLGILDYLSVNLYVDKTAIPNRFDKRSFLNFNAIPTNIYRGRHVEDTGLSEDTLRLEAFIAPWDSLVDDIYVSKKDLGVTYQEPVENDNPIDHHMYCYTFNVKTKNVNKIKPVVFICCNVHGHEKSSTIGAYYLMKDVVEHYSEDPVLNFLRNNVTIKVIPAANAYGIINNKRQNGNGVNINRNYPTFSWNEYKETASDTEAWGYNATGDNAASELETQYIINELLSSGRNTALAIDLHTNGRDSTYQELLYANYHHVFYGNYDYRIRDVLAAYFCSMRGVIDSYNMPKMDKAYGGLVEGNNYPSFGNWLFESTDIVGGTLEIPCGSRSDALGPNLTFYSKDTLKLCGELLGNYIIHMLRGLSVNDGNN